MSKNASIVIGLLVVIEWSWVSMIGKNLFLSINDRGEA